MKQLGVGIIGTGSIANSCHAPAVLAVAKTSLVGVLSRDRDTGRDFLQRHGVNDGVVHTSLDSFTSDSNIDLAIICTPDRLHSEQATACLKAGKHLLLEKPMAVNAEDALEMVELATENGLTLASGFHLRSHVGHRLLHTRIVRQQELGTLRHIRAIWAFPQQDDSNWRAKEELAKWWSLAAVGAHCIDLARWFANNMDDWKQFSSIVSTARWHGPHDETAVIAAQMSTGLTVEVTSSVQFGTYHRLELFGDKGYATCEGTMGREGAGEIRLNNAPILFEPVSPFIGQLENLVESIETQVAPRADGFVGLRSVKDLILAGSTSVPPTPGATTRPHAL